MSKGSSSFWKFISCIALCLGVGLASHAYIDESLKTWYACLARPALTPPNIVFPIVWTLLYILMGLSLFLFWTTKKKKNARIAYVFFFIQLFMNFLWPISFFYLHNPLLALFVITLLIVFLGGTLFFFRQSNTLSAYLLIPYFVWTLFAFYLNYEFYRLNP